MSDIPEVSVVVVNYNGLHLMDDCLASLSKITVPYDVVVVDNASSDGSASYLRQRYPEVSVIDSGANLGFGRGCNLGASASRGRYILLLNSDARLLGDVKPALTFIRNHPDVAVVGGALTYGNGAMQPSIGLEHTPARLVASWMGLGGQSWAPSLFRRELRDPEEYAAARADVAWVSGALMLVERAAWERVGGMHPGYFMYVEDVDLCRAMRRDGRKIGFLPEWRAVHLEGGGKEWIGRFALLNTVDSYRVYLRRHHSAAGALAARLGLVPVFAARALVNALLAVATGARARRERAAAFAEACKRLAR